MYSYVSLYIVLFLFSFIKKNNTYEKKIYILLFILVWLFAGLRYDTGWDYVGYKESFQNLPTLSEFIFGQKSFYNSLYYEKGYKILNILIKTIFDNYYFFSFIVSLLITFLLLNSFREYTEYYFLSIMIYFGGSYLFTHMSIIRQGIAIALFIYSIRYIKSRELKKYTILILLGITFHITLLLLYPVYFIPKIKKKWLIFIIIILNILYLARFRWIILFYSGIGNLILPEYVYNKLNYYINSISFNSDRGIGLGYIERNIIFIIAIFYKNRCKNKYYEIFFNIYFYYLIIYFLFFEVAVIFDRLKFYFLVSNAVFYTYFVNIFKSKKYLIIFILNIYSYFLLYTILSYDVNRIVYVPYNTVFKDVSQIPKEQKGKDRETKALELKIKNIIDSLE